MVVKLQRIKLNHMLTITKHRKVMLSVLKKIYGDSVLGSILGFKGGTLLYILYDLPRFSVDLDFDLLDEQKGSEVLPRLEKILKEFGQTEQLIEKKYTYFALINHEKGQQHLKIEISKRNLGSFFEIKSYLGIPIRTMVKEDIIANKLVALVDRKNKANRDMFDTQFLLKNNWDINWGLVEKRTGLDKANFLKKAINLIENWPLENILTGLGEVLDAKTKAWVKDNLAKDTIFQLKLLV